MRADANRHTSSGKIQSLTVTPEGTTQSASVTFEKETAAKTALLLDNTQLGPSQVNVTAAASSSTSAKSGDTQNDDIAQEDKPRSRVVAEMLAHGYVIGDSAIQRAISLDQQHGISNRFTTALTQFDQRFKATETAQGLDQKYNISQRATEGWKGLYSYFDKAQNTPTGQRLRAFYDQGQKQVLDVHNEARHLANLKAGKKPEDLSKTEGTAEQKEKQNLETFTVDGKERTTCNCGGTEGACPCAPGKCACSGCAKAS